jgi:hypothetical protein
LPRHLERQPDRSRQEIEQGLASEKFYHEAREGHEDRSKGFSYHEEKIEKLKNSLSDFVLLCLRIFAACANFLDDTVTLGILEIIRSHHEDREEHEVERQEDYFLEAGFKPASKSYLRDLRGEKFKALNAPGP